MEGVGATALMTAAARALESEKPDPLLSDPFARSLAGEQGFELLDRGATGPTGTNGASLYVVRHRFFDDVLIEILGGSDIRQVALLAAGLDTRAFRLEWPPGTRLFEIDQSAVLAHKNASLETQRALPRCDRYEVAADLRDDWTQALVSAGFEPDRPTIWVAEGLLYYLPEVAVHRLLDETHRLSAPGSYLATDFLSALGPPQEFKDLFASLGAPFVFFTDDPARLLRGHHWDGEAIEFDEVGRRVGIEFPRAGRVIVARS